MRRILLLATLLAIPRPGLCVGAPSDETATTPSPVASDRLVRVEEASSLLAARKVPGLRILLEGVVTGVEPAPEGSKISGYLQVQTPQGVPYRFRVMSWTLILVKDARGRLWAGRFKHVQVGWPASVAYALDPDVEDGAPPAMLAENMIVDARR